MTANGGRLRRNIRRVFWLAPMAALLLIAVTMRMGHESDRFVEHNFDVYQSARYILKTNLLVQKGWGISLEALQAKDPELLEVGAMTVESAAAFIKPLSKMNITGVPESSSEDIVAFAEALYRVRDDYLQKDLVPPEEEIEGLAAQAKQIYNHFTERDRKHYGVLSNESTRLQSRTRHAYIAMVLLGGLILLLLETVRRTMRAELRADRKLKKAYAFLEQRVDERTRELAQTNKELMLEAAERQRAEDERGEIERQMLHAQKLESLGVLAGGIAHDFNNMLQGVLGNTELALECVGSDSKVRKHLKAIEGTSLRAGEIVKQMLAYSGKGHFASEPVKLGELSREMAGFLEAVVSKKATIEFDTAEKLSLIDGDPTQIRQVLMNLIINSSEALEGEPGKITISTGTLKVEPDELTELYGAESLAVPGEFVYLKVSDEGCGMDAEVADKIFDPFFTTKFAGRGLGMSAVLGIMRAHSGALKIESAPGQGTSIWLIFPTGRIAWGGERRAQGSEGRRSTIGRKGLVVLLADDEPEVLAAAEQFLSRCGCRVLPACDGLEAVELYECHGEEIDIAVLDIAMPRLDGNQAFKKLRELNPELPVLLCSGYTEEHLETGADDQAGSDFLAKPYLPSVLAAKVNELCRECPSQG